MAAMPAAGQYSTFSSPPGSSRAGPSGDAADAPPASPRLKALRDAKAAIQEQAVRFGASRVMPFNRTKYFLWTFKSYLSVYITGRWPQFYWQWHAFQVVVLSPVHAWRWQKLKSLGYFMEFCWLANFCITAYLCVARLAPDQLSPAVRGTAFRLIFAFGSGPLGCAVMLLANSLVPHSVDHAMSLLIHLQPLITSYTLRWHTAHEEPSALQGLFGWKQEPALFPVEDVVPFGEYMAAPCAFLAVYAVVHATWFLTRGDAMLRDGHATTPHYNLMPRNPKGNLFTKLFGRWGSGGSDALRYLKYQGMSIVTNIMACAATYPLYRWGTARIHFGIVLMMCGVSVWNGAEWYATNLRRLTEAIDKLIVKEEKGQ